MVAHSLILPIMNTAKTIQLLDFKDVPIASIGRYWLTLFQDMLGNIRTVPVTVLRGKLEGPTLGITTIVQNGSTGGIPIIHQLINQIDVNKLRGTLVCALLMDFPAISPTQHGQPSPTSYLGQLTIGLLDQVDYLVNLRADSTGYTSIHTVHADLSDHETTLMIRPLDAPLVVDSPAAEGSIRCAAQWLNIPTVTMTLGATPKPPLASIRRVLDDLDMLPYEATYRNVPAQNFDATFWIRARHTGLLTMLPNVGEFVEEGQLIAQQTNLFGVPIADYRVPFDGIVVCKHTIRLVEQGTGLLQLAMTDEPTSYKRQMSQQKTVI